MVGMDGFTMLQDGSTKALLAFLDLNGSTTQRLDHPVVEMGLFCGPVAAARTSGYKSKQTDGVFFV